MNKLSRDELGQIAKFSSKKNISKLRNIIEDYKHMDCVRCLSTEKQFKKRLGISMDKWFKIYQAHKNLIDDLLLSNFEEQLGEKVEIEPLINEYFYNLFKFNFDKNIIAIYIRQYVTYIIRHSYTKDRSYIPYGNLMYLLNDKRDIEKLKNSIQDNIKQLIENDMLIYDIPSNENLVYDLTSLEL